MRLPRRSPDGALLAMTSPGYGDLLTQMLVTMQQGVIASERSERGNLGCHMPGFVYILTNRSNQVLYTGVTRDLVKRVWQHRNGRGSRFTEKYRTHKLVYYELCDDIRGAIEREKQLKARLSSS